MWWLFSYCVLSIVCVALNKIEAGEWFNVIILYIQYYWIVHILI